MVSENLSRDEINRRGAKLYEDSIRKLVEPARNGHYVVLDVLTGDYEVDADHLAASDRVVSRHPKGVFYALRIGQETIGRIGVRGLGN